MCSGKIYSFRWKLAASKCVCSSLASFCWNELLHCGFPIDCCTDPQLYSRWQWPSDGTSTKKRYVHHLRIGSLNARSWFGKYLGKSWCKILNHICRIQRVSISWRSDGKVRYASIYYWDWFNFNFFKTLKYSKIGYLYSFMCSQNWKILKIITFCMYISDALQRNGINWGMLCQNS